MKKRLILITALFSGAIHVNNVIGSSITAAQLKEIYKNGFHAFYNEALELQHIMPGEFREFVLECRLNKGLSQTEAYNNFASICDVTKDDLSRPILVPVQGENGKWTELRNIGLILHRLIDETKLLEYNPVSNILFHEKFPRYVVESTCTPTWANVVQNATDTLLEIIAEKIAAFGTKPSDDDTFEIFFEKKEDELSGPTGVITAKKGIVLTDETTKNLLKLLESCNEQSTENTLDTIAQSIFDHLKSKNILIQEKLIKPFLRTIKNNIKDDDMIDLLDIQNFITQNVIYDENSNQIKISCINNKSFSNIQEVFIYITQLLQTENNILTFLYFANYNLLKEFNKIINNYLDNKNDYSQYLFHISQYLSNYYHKNLCDTISLLTKRVGYFTSDTFAKIHKKPSSNEQKFFDYLRSFLSKTASDEYFAIDGEIDAFFDKIHSNIDLESIFKIMNLPTSSFKQKTTTSTLQIPNFNEFSNQFEQTELRFNTTTHTAENTITSSFNQKTTIPTLQIPNFSTFSNQFEQSVLRFDTNTHTTSDHDFSLTNTNAISVEELLYRRYYNKHFKDEYNMSNEYIDTECNTLKISKQEYFTQAFKNIIKNIVYNFLHIENSEQNVSLTEKRTHHLSVITKFFRNFEEFQYGTNTYRKSQEYNTNTLSILDLLIDISNFDDQTLEKITRDMTRQLRLKTVAKVGKYAAITAGVVGIGFASYYFFAPTITTAAAAVGSALSSLGSWSTPKPITVREQIKWIDPRIDLDSCESSTVKGKFLCDLKKQYGEVIKRPVEIQCDPLESGKFHCGTQGVASSIDNYIRDNYISEKEKTSKKDTKTPPTSFDTPTKETKTFKIYTLDTSTEERKLDFDEDLTNNSTLVKTIKDRKDATYGVFEYSKDGKSKTIIYCKQNKKYPNTYSFCSKTMPQ